MRKKIEWSWEIIDEFTKRVKVIGGWLVQFGCHSNKGSVSASMVFVADRDHEWHIAAPYKEEIAAKPAVKASDFETPK